MTITTTTLRHTRATATGRRGTMRRVASLARAEAMLLRRSPIALITALVSPAAMVLFVKASMPPETTAALGGGAQVVISVGGFTLLFVVYYNLVSALVARREELVLKRLRTGECSDAEILAGTVAPAVAIAWTQIVIAVVVATTVFDMGRPTNPVLALTGIALGTMSFVLLAAVSSALSRTVQIAELTTSPVLVASMVFSGLMFPLTQLPGPAQAVAHALPLTPVVDLLRLGLSGITPSGADVDLLGSLRAALAPGVTLLAWVALGAVAMRWFRWEPRH